MRVVLFSYLISFAFFSPRDILASESYFGGVNRRNSFAELSSSAHVLYFKIRDYLGSTLVGVLLTV